MRNQSVFGLILVSWFFLPQFVFAETLTPTFIGHSITAYSGDLRQTETDLKIPARGFDYEFTRT